MLVHIAEYNSVLHFAQTFRHICILRIPSDRVILAGSFVLLTTFCSLALNLNLSLHPFTDSARFSKPWQVFTTQSPRL